jgi:hypothetical protein
MKHQVDKKRSEREFKVGDTMYLKLQPHIQSSVAFRSNHKLSFRFFGPFKVLARIGAVAYKMELPTSAQIHPMVHVFQLKQHVPPNTEVFDSLDAVATNHDDSMLLVQVLAVRDILVGSKMKQGSMARTTNLVGLLGRCCRYEVQVYHSLGTSCCQRRG